MDILARSNSMISDRPDRGRRGFTLAEILVALAVFSLGITGVFALFGTATFTAQQSFDITEAEMLLDSVCAELEMIPDRYRPQDLTQPDGRPQVLLQANGGGIPANGSEIQLPANWPGAIENRGPGDPDFGNAGRMTYDIVFTPLTQTADPATGLPQCSLATITMYWQRVGRAITLERKLVVRWVR